MFRSRFLLGLAATAAAAPAAAGAPPAPGPPFHASEPELERCLAGAVSDNPAVVAARARVRAARQRIPQARALPDPTVSVSQALRSVETRVGARTGGIMVAQSLPWFGARALRGQVAASEADALDLLREAGERDVLARARRAFFDLAYLDAALRLLDEEHSLLGHYEGLAQARYASGQGLQHGVLRLQAELTRVRDRRQRLDRRRGALAVSLNTLCGRAADTAIAPIPPVGMAEAPVARERLLELGERNRQELRAAAARVDAGEDAVELAGMRFRPRFTASLEVWNVVGRDRRESPTPLPPDEGKNAVGVSLGVSLPVWKESYRAGVEEAGARLTAERFRLEEARAEMEAAVEQALIRIESLEEQIELLDRVLIPQSEETLRATEAAYRTGQAGVLDLLDSERVQLDVRRMRARCLSDLRIALSDLERGIGAPVPTDPGRSS